MTTIGRFTISIAVLAVFALAAVLVAREADDTVSADEGQKFIGLWQTIQSISDGSLQTLSISDIDGDGVFQIGFHESFFSSCGGGFHDKGVGSGTATVNEEGTLIADLTITCTPGPVVSFVLSFEPVKQHDQLVGSSGDVYHRISRR